MIPNKNKYLLTLAIAFFTSFLNGQNTFPSCVITAPHSNAYFMQGTNLNMQRVHHIFVQEWGGGRNRI